jgi:hypothetical protein
MGDESGYLKAVNSIALSPEKIKMIGQDSLKRVLPD